jgi:hypothetical protein
MTRSEPLALPCVDLDQPRGANLTTQFLHERIFERRQGIDDVGVEQFQ